MQVAAVQLQDVDPPEAVAAAFKDVTNAKEDREKLINQAQGYRNDIIPRAKGEAAELVNRAKGFAQARLNRAQGEANRFLATLKEYNQSKDVISKRIYIETMEEILPNMEKIIIDGKGGERLLPYLPLDRRSKLTAASGGKASSQLESEEPREEPSPTLIMSSGFAEEPGEAGAKMQAELKAIAARYGLTVGDVQDVIQTAIVVQLGKPVRNITEPGLYMKVPFVQEVTYFDKRLLDYDSNAQDVITSDKKTLLLDNFAKWRIVDPLKVYQNFQSQRGALQRLHDIIYSELRVELGLVVLDLLRRAGEHLRVGLAAVDVGQRRAFAAAVAGQIEGEGAVARGQGEQRAGAGDVGAAHLRIVLGQRLVDDAALRAGHLDDRLGDLLDGQLGRVADLRHRHLEGACGGLGGGHIAGEGTRLVERTRLGAQVALCRQQPRLLVADVQERGPARQQVGQRQGRRGGDEDRRGDLADCAGARQPPRRARLCAQRRLGGAAGEPPAPRRQHPHPGGAAALPGRDRGAAFGLTPDSGWTRLAQRAALILLGAAALILLQLRYDEEAGVAMAALGERLLDVPRLYRGPANPA